MIPQLNVLRIAGFLCLLPNIATLQKGINNYSELTQNAILEVIPHISSALALNADSFYVYSKLSYMPIGPEIPRLTLACQFCDWSSAPDSLDLGIDFVLRRPKNVRTRPILTEVDNKERAVYQFYFSPLVPTRIKKHFVIQCNAFRYGDRDYRLILIKRKGNRFKYVTDIYTIHTLF